MAGRLRNGTMSKRSLVGVRSLILGLLLHILLVESVVATTGLDHNSLRPCSERDPLMDPTYEVRYGQEVVWQIPPYAKAIFYIAHGVGQDALGFFDPAPNCRRCYGLPESREVVLEALRRGYAVIVVKSIGRLYDTEWPVEASKDLALVTKIIEDWTRENQLVLDGLPLTVWGHSDGSKLASALALRLPVRALYLSCGEGLIEVYERASPERFPPTFFAFMPMDVESPALNITWKDEKAMGILRKRGVKVAEKPCWPKPLSPLFFTERISCLSDDMSLKVFAAFEDAEWLDSGAYLTRNPEEEDWRSVLRNAGALPICWQIGDICLAAHVEQELQMAFAQHSVTSDANDAVFQWLDSIVASSSASGMSVEFRSSNALAAEI